MPGLSPKEWEEYSRRMYPELTGGPAPTPDAEEWARYSREKYPDLVGPSPTPVPYDPRLDPMAGFASLYVPLAQEEARRPRPPQEKDGFLTGITQVDERGTRAPGAPPIIHQPPVPPPSAASVTSPPGSSLKSQALAGWEEGQLQLAEGITGWNWMMGNIPEEEAKSRRGEYLKQMAALQKTAPEWEWGNIGSVAQGMTRATAKLAPYMGRTIMEAQMYGLATGMGFGGTAAIAGQLGPQIAAPEEIVTVPGAIAAGYAVGTTFGSIKSAMEIEGGSIYAQLRDEGIEHGTAKLVALGAGALIGTIEMLQVGRVLKHLPGGKYFSKRAITKAVMEHPKLRTRLAKIGLEFTKDISIEVGQEISQELVTLGGEALAHAANAVVKEVKYGGPTVKDAVGRVYETGTEMLKGIPGLLLPGKAVQVGKAIKAGPVQAEAKTGPQAAPPTQRRAASVEPPSEQQQQLEIGIEEGNRRIAEREAAERIAAEARAKKEAEAPEQPPPRPHRSGKTGGQKCRGSSRPASSPGSPPAAGTAGSTRRDRPTRPRSRSSSGRPGRSTRRRPPSGSSAARPTPHPRPRHPDPGPGRGQGAIISRK